MDDNEVYSGFDDVIGEEADSGGFVLLEPGIYPFSITEAVGRERTNGTDKIPPCWKAVVKLKVDGGNQGKTTIFHNILLAKKQAWKIKQLFVGVGLIGKDDKNFVAPWDKLPGTVGAVEIGTHEYNGKTYNDVVRILDPMEASETVAVSTNTPPATMQFNFPGA